MSAEEPEKNGKVTKYDFNAGDRAAEWRTYNRALQTHMERRASKFIQNFSAKGSKLVISDIFTLPLVGSLTAWLFVLRKNSKGSAIFPQLFADDGTKETQAINTARKLYFDDLQSHLREYLSS